MLGNCSISEPGKKHFIEDIQFIEKVHTLLNKKLPHYITVGRS